MLISLASTGIRRVRVGVAFFAFAATIVAAHPAPAAFHVHLRRSDPADSAHLASAPTVIRLWFSGKVELAVTGATLTGANGAAVSLSDAAMANASDTAAVVFTIKGALPPGRYDVAWRTAAPDMHPTRARFSFTIDAAAAPLPRKP
ncbi:MAG: copper resistance CopC family protein [Gemmatimonadaceae bacterium]